MIIATWIVYWIKLNLMDADSFTECDIHTISSPSGCLSSVTTVIPYMSFVELVRYEEVPESTEAVKIRLYERSVQYNLPLWNVIEYASLTCDVVTVILFDPFVFDFSILFRV